MKKHVFIITFILVTLLELSICLGVIHKVNLKKTDISVINDCVNTIEKNFGNEEKYPRDLSYTILDNSANIIYTSGEEAAESIVNAIKDNDLILDISVDGENVGKIIIQNNQAKEIDNIKKILLKIVCIFSLIQIIMVVSFYLYLRNRIINPFEKLSDFAVRVAGGNLDIPLDMDKNHIFGGFTESFDLMRSELKKARIAEKKANDDKKEIIAKLSHDIKTPVASIKASSEIGYELAKTEKEKEYFNLINVKADQVTTLVDNLFNSSVKDATKISVNPSFQPSLHIKTILVNADYLGKIDSDYTIPECNVFMDKLRLQQVFDNIITNSYKYAGTNINITVLEDETYLCIKVVDFGPGVKEDEVHLLKEKYRRGDNIIEKEGAGLGLYLADYFMKEMGGKLEIESKDGFTVKVYIRKSND